MKTIKNFLCKKRKILKSKSGFSLMELLVVVGIMGVISALAIPAYDKYRESANKNGAKAEAKTIYRALQTCLANGTTAATCAGGDGNIEKTISKKCIVADGTNTTDAKQKSKADSDGKCFMMQSSGEYCVASNIGGEIHCIDKHSGDNPGKSCNTSGSNIGKCKV